MISYCIAVYRPRYVMLQIDDLATKTSCDYEILLWINTDAPELIDFVLARQMEGIPIRVVGITPHNIGMVAYRHLFEATQYELITQMDDDVLRISPRIAQKAAAIFNRFPTVKQLVADTWQDQWTNGARFPMENYQPVAESYGLYLGKIDGWFSVYHRSALPILMEIEYSRYCILGSTAQLLLLQRELYGLLCTQFKVLHINGPYYAHLFGLFEAEIKKFRSVERQDMVEFYEGLRGKLPTLEDLQQGLATAMEHIDQFDPVLPSE